MSADSDGRMKITQDAQNAFQSLKQDGGCA